MRERKMVKIGDVFPSRYLKAADLGTAQPVVVIQSVKIEDMGEGRNKESKPVLYFAGKEKGLVCNKTNSFNLAKITGSDDTDGWKGHSIQLYTAEVEAFGEMVDAIRVRAVKGAKPPEPVEFAADDGDVPF